MSEATEQRSWPNRSSYILYTIINSIVSTVPTNIRILRIMAVLSIVALFTGVLHVHDTCGAYHII